MMEYEILSEIIDEKFKSVDQDILSETKGAEHKPQIVKINSKGSGGISKILYRFDLEKDDFLPFFNHTDKASRGLRAFCDYVLLVNCKGNTYIVLMELKRGKIDSEVKSQLNAAQTFINYVIASAERLKKDFPVDYNNDFDGRNVKWRKVILKDCKSNKKTTKGKKDVDTSEEFIQYNCCGSIRLAALLR